MTIIASVYGTGTDRGVCRVFQKLLKTVPHLEELSVEFSNEEAMAMVQGQPGHQVENGTASREALDGMLKQRSYGRSGSEWCLSCQIGRHQGSERGLKGVGLNWISSRDISLNRLLHWHVMLTEGDAIEQCSHP
jgi:hypothetical protein